MSVSRLMSPGEQVQTRIPSPNIAMTTISRNIDAAIPSCLMPVDFDQKSFDRALEEFRLADAEELASGADQSRVGGLLAEVESRRAAAEEAAKQRYQRIIDLAAAESFPELLEIRHDPTTAPLLALLSKTARDRAEPYLRDADRWEQSRRRINTRRLAEARKALAGLDLQLARSLVARIDDRFLDEQGFAERDELLLALSARTMEVESLRATGEQLIEDSPPQKRSRWRRRRD